jgi:hypothetical protein
MGATPQDLLRFLPRNPKGVLLRYGEASGVVERVEPSKLTAGGECNQQEMVIKPTARNECPPKCRTKMNHHEFKNGNSTVD